MVAKRAPRSRPSRSRANRERGEHTVTLGGVEYPLRPSAAAIFEIEEATGRSAIELLRAANTCALGFVELGAILAPLIRAGADDEMTRHVSEDRISELVYEQGVASVTAVVTLTLADVIGGGRTASGEAKAVATTATR